VAGVGGVVLAPGGVPFPVDSQIENVDFTRTYAATLPSCCLRLWCTIVADERLDTDKIDAVKAFTQSAVDAELYVEMPVGFAIAGYCLYLLKALEGIRQGSFLWFRHNKWAWNKVGMFADSLVEPNLYTHPDLNILAAVFADDVGCGFDPEIRREYLLIRAEYGRLIKIDSVSPDQTVPVTIFTGVDVAIDREAGTVAISMRTYIHKLMDRHGESITLRELPTASSKAKRQEFDDMEPGTAETALLLTGPHTSSVWASWLGPQRWSGWSSRTTRRGSGATCSTRRSSTWTRRRGAWATSSTTLRRASRTAAS
jgi:hypothetical protein